MEEQKKRDEEKRKKVESERKKQQDQMKQVKTNGTSSDGAGDRDATVAVTPARLKKNFASLDCGSKVINANPAARGSGNIIAPSK